MTYDGPPEPPRDIVAEVQARAMLPNGSSEELEGLAKVLQTFTTAEAVTSFEQIEPPAWMEGESVTRSAPGPTVSMMVPPKDRPELRAVAETSEEESSYFALQAKDWTQLLLEGVPEMEYLDRPYIPKGVRVWLWGATGTAKSMWAMWAAARMSWNGHGVAYFSEENPLPEDLRRLAKLRPNPECFSWFHLTGMDLADADWIGSMLEATKGYDVIVFDTFTDRWGGDENKNDEVRDFDKHVLKPLIDRGSTSMAVHHTGHPQMFSGRRAATSGRGASSLGQKADVVLEFVAEEDGAFTIVYGKPRIGGERLPNRTFRVIDTEDEGLDIVEVAGHHERQVAELVTRMVEAITTIEKGYLTTTELRNAVKSASALQRDALAVLEEDERVRMTSEKVPNKDGKVRPAKVWRPAGHEQARLGQSK